MHSSSSQGWSHSQPTWLVKPVQACKRTLPHIAHEVSIALPTAIVMLGGYLVLAGSVAAAMSSVAVEPDAAVKTSTNAPA